MINVVGRIGYLWGSKHNRVGGGQKVHIRGYSGTDKRERI